MDRQLAIPQGCGRDRFRCLGQRIAANQFTSRFWRRKLHMPGIFFSSVFFLILDYVL